MNAGTNGAPAESSKPDIKVYFQQLDAQCQSIFEKSLDAQNVSKVSESHLFANEVGKWYEVLKSRKESELVRVASLEYEMGLFFLTQGHYRQAFKGTRLVFELILQAVQLSANELCLRDWLENRVDTSWSAIVNGDNGVFSHRFATAFFPDLIPHISHYGQLAASIYRECSECVHGNTPKHVLLPSGVEFDQDVFDNWHNKAACVALVSHFALSLRYLRDLSETELGSLEPFLVDHLGHLAEIRQYLGGPTK